MNTLKILKYCGLVSVFAVLVSLMWFFGVIGDIAKPLVQSSLSVDKCEIIYRSSCGEDPIAVNSKYSILYGNSNNDRALCDMSIDPSDRENIRPTLQEGKCAIDRGLDNGCEREILNTFDSNNLESVSIDGVSDRRKLMKLGSCGRAYQRTYLK